MPRNRVLSFMSQWGGAPRSPTSDTPPSPGCTNAVENRRPTNIDTATPPPESGRDSPSSPTTRSRARGDSKPPRPMSMLMSYNPPQVEMTQDTPPELQPIFSYLNSHSNKLYQEGYFLKLHDLDSRGRPSADRAWVECFAQLIGTVLSLWDAAALDVAGQDGEVVPTFINLSDASIKMIESLPMNGAQGGTLQNVLSVSTAANNRYLLHFNSLNSLTQWTAGIRLAMFEHTTLQEAYTGSIIAGKGRMLNGIKQIMFRSQFAHEDWARVRFGAGTPWQRCWCVISPPDEKEYNKATKTLKKNSAYERTKLPKGDIKFYDTRKVTKKTRPIATISDAYAAYAIYPQSKPLIDQSTLVKLEGLVTLHESSQDSTNEGFVFVMPEVHAAVTGFEMMLRWLFPVYDTFGLYGRPTKLIADTLDQRGLMFAMPTDRRYGHLDILDVSGLIHAKGSQQWSERQWRRELKKLTADRMLNSSEGPSSRNPSQRRNTTSRTSMPPSNNAVRFGSGDDYTHSTPGSRSGSRDRAPGPENGIQRTDSAPPGGFSSPHKRAASESYNYKRYQTETPSRLSHENNRSNEEDMPPRPPAHGGVLKNALGAVASAASSRSKLERIQSENEVPTQSTYEQHAQPAASPHLMPLEPVTEPPAFTHSPNSKPAKKPYPAPELRRAHSNVDAATLHQMQDAVRPDDASDERRSDEGTWDGEVQQRQQNTVASQSNARSLGVPADNSQGVVNRKQRDPRQRLSTIPGSPYVGDDASYFQSPAEMAPPPMDGVAEEPKAENSQSSTPNGQSAPSVPLHSSRSIARKPVPRSSTTSPPIARSMSDATSESSVVVNDENWAGGWVDEEALNRVLNAPDRSNTMQTTTTESTEPDYASTISTKSPKKSVERPRAGKLKTVGNSDLPTVDPHSGGAGRLDTWQMDQNAQGAAIPSVDFGPTYAYKPNANSRPGTSGTLIPSDMADKRRSHSGDRLRNRMSGVFGVSPRPSPNESNRHSYFAGGRNTPSPGGRITPEPGLAGDRSSMLWQPSGGSPGATNQNRNSISAEQWVQQRANMSQQQQQYVAPRTNSPHGRTASTQHVRRRLTKTPPPGRTLSGDWTQARMSPPIRPSSRGAGVNLDSAGATLTAREQMQVSRATGSPLIDLAGSKRNDASQQPGMMGYMAARERDKAASKEGRNSMAVQQAIERQQQQQMRMEAEAQAQQQYQIQMQAAQQQQMHQRQMQQMSQQMNWNNQMPMQYGAQQQRPQLQNRISWAGYGQQGHYNHYSPNSQYGPGGTPTYDGRLSPGPQQAYGGNYFPQQQQQQQQ